MKKLLFSVICLMMVIAIVPSVIFAEEIAETFSGQILSSNISNSLNHNKFLERDTDINPEDWIDQPIFDENMIDENVSTFSLGGNNLSYQYTVLVLDDSGSMSGTPSTQMRKAAVKFCNKLLESKNNYVAIVKYGSSALIACGFTNNIDYLTSAINTFNGNSGVTDMNAGVQMAYSMFSVIDDVYEKNIVIMSDGLPQSGSYSSTGKYSSGTYYKYCNVVYDTVSGLWNEYSIYTLGFFHNMSGSTKTFAQTFMSDLQNQGYYDVVNGDSFEVTFEGLASDILEKFSGGTGTKADPVLINTYAQMEFLSEIVAEGTDCAGVYFKLNKDITANNTNNWTNGKPDASTSVSVWTPIGSYFTPFRGNFDGGKYKISGLYTFENSYNALFGYVVDGSVNNVQIIDSYIGGDSYLAGIASYIKNSTINNCIFNGKVYSKSGDYIGGIVSCADNSTIKNCENIGEITGNNLYVGGIGANISGTTINCCTNTGEIKGKSHYVGGIAGVVSKSKVLNFSNKAKVSGNKNVGGISGKVLSSDLSNGFNIGDVSAKDPVANIAGIIENSTANNIYSTGAVDTGSWIHAVDDASFDEMKSTELFAVYSTNSRIVSLPTWERVESHSPVESIGIPPDDAKKDAFLALLNNWVDKNNSASKYNKWVLKDSYPELDYAYQVFSDKKIYDGFNYDNNEYHHELAMLAAKYSAFAYETYSYDKKNEVFFDSVEALYKKNNTGIRIRETLIADGFSSVNIWSEKMYTGSTNEDIDHSATFTAATKTVNYKGEPRKLLVIAIRGTDAEQWYGNMDVTGSSYDSNLEKYHQSFKISADIIKTYIQEKGIVKEGDNSLVLLTGHSRGAAVANLIAKEYTDGGHNGIDKDCVFAYCFATPNLIQVGQEDDVEKYKNIYNMTFDDDFVPRLPMKDWGYNIYGQRRHVSAQKLYANKKVDFGNWEDISMIYSEGRTPDFNKNAVDSVMSYIPTVWKNVEEYYYTEATHIATIETDQGPLPVEQKENLYLRNFMHDTIAKACADGAGFGTLVELKIKSGGAMQPVRDFFWNGSVPEKYLNDNHQMYTYYNALKSDGFKPAAEVSAVSYASPFSLLSLDSYDETELTALKNFLEYENNGAIMQCDPEDVSTWNFVTWEDGFVKEIDLYYKNCTGVLDVSNFEYLEVLDVSGNELTGLNVSGCTSLSELYCPNNKLTELNIEGLNLSAIDCTGNYLDVNLLESEFEQLIENESLVNYEYQNVPGDATYNQNDKDILSYIVDLIQGDIEVDVDQLMSYSVWKKADNEYRICKLNISNLGLTGDLILAGLNYLEEINCSNNYLDTLDVTDCVNLRTINCSDNNITMIYGLPDNLETILCSNNAIDVSAYSIQFEAITTNGGVIISDGQVIDISMLNEADVNLLNELIKNAELEIDDVSVWNAVEWKPYGESYYISSLNLDGYNTISGVLDLSELIHCESVTAAGTSIQEIYLPYGMTEITESAFIGCDNLTDVILPGTIIKIGKRAFANCSNLAKIDLPPSLSVIDDEAFLNCETLRTVYIPAAISKIGANAYAGCSELMNVYFIGGVAECVDNTAFDSCGDELKILSFSENNREDFSHTIEVIEPLSIKQYPEKLIYEPCSEIDLSGLVLEYVNTTEGTIQEITDGWSVNYDFSEFGNATVTVSYLEYSVMFDVVVRVAVSGVILNVDTLALEYLEEYSLIATVYPENATDKEVVWYTSDENVATVDQTGKVQGVGSGEAVIWVETVDGNFTALCEISVHVAVQGIDFQESDMQIYVGEEYEIPYYFTPQFPTNSNVSIEVDNPEIVDVVLNDGFVYLHAYDAGFVNISITTEDGGFIDTLQLCVKYPKMKVISNEAKSEADYWLQFRGTAIGNIEDEYILGVDYGKSLEEVEQRKNTKQYWMYFSSYNYRAERDIAFEIVAKPNTTYYYRMFAYNSIENKYYWDDIKTVTTEDYELPSQTILDSQCVKMTADTAYAYRCVIEEPGLYSFGMLTENDEYAYLSAVDSEFNQLDSTEDAFGYQQYYFLDAGETIFIYAFAYMDGTYTFKIDKSASLILDDNDNTSTIMNEGDICYIRVNSSGLYQLFSFGSTNDLTLYDNEGNQIAYFWAGRNTYLYLERDTDYHLVGEYMEGEYTELELYRLEFEKTISHDEEFETNKTAALWEFIPEETGFYTIDIQPDIPNDGEYYCYANLLLTDDGIKYYSRELSYYEKMMYTDEEGNPIYDEYSGQRCELFEKGKSYYIYTGYHVYSDGDASILSNVSCKIRKSEPPSLNVGENILNGDMVYNYLAFTPKSSGTYRFIFLNENNEVTDGNLYIDYFYKNEEGECIYDYKDGYYGGTVSMILNEDRTYYLAISSGYYLGNSKLVIEKENMRYLPEDFRAQEIISKSTEISINTPGEVLYFTFTPDVKGDYSFSTDGNCDTMCSIYDSDNDYILTNYDGGENNNFHFSRSIQEGEICILEIKLEDPTDIGTFTLNIERKINLDDIVTGDVNGDGEVDFADGILILKHDVGLSTLTEEKLIAGDVNGDGEVDFSDAILVLKYDVGLIKTFSK